MTPENEVYKLIGPVLVKQDQQEAKANVDQRLGLIQGDMWVTICLSVFIRYRLATFRKRVEAQIKEIGGKLDKKKTEVCVD